jgi:hypothetical protein
MGSDEAAAPKNGELRGGTFVLIVAAVIIVINIAFATSGTGPWGGAWTAFPAAIAIGAVLLTRRGQADAEPAPEFVADPLNRHEVVVRGWSDAELAEILREFARMYGLDAATAFRVAPGNTDALSITFPADLKPSLIYFLVNYLQYPSEFEVDDRAIGVVGHVILTPAFDPPDPTLVGQAADLYVPRDDRDYDLVYARTRSGRAYAVSFTNLKWKPVGDPRMPDTMAGL